MKALSMRISAGVIALGALLYILACSPATQNNNSSQNQNLAGNQAGVASKLEPCETSIGDPGHGEGLKGKIKDKIKNKPFSSLKKLLKDTDNPDGTFTVEVQQVSNGTYFVAYVRGKVSGDDNLKELSDILNDFQDEKNCLRMVYLLPNQTSPVAEAVPGFEWSSCEYPKYMCTNGECCEGRSENSNTTPSPTPNGNGNSNSNSNSNLRGGKP